MPYPREAERDYLYTRRIILVLFSLIAAFLMSACIDKGLSYLAIELDYNKTDATIVKVEEKSDGLRLLTYSFVTTKGINKEVMIAARWNTFNHEPELGESLPVVFSGFLPDQNTPYELHQYHKSSFYICLFSALVIVITIVLVFFTGKKIQKQKEEDKYY